MSEQTGLRGVVQRAHRQVLAPVARAVVRGLARVLPEPIAPYAPWIVVGAVAAAGFVGLASLASGAFSGRSPTLDQPQIAAVGSSWVLGQPSLADSAGFLAVVEPAAQLAQQRYAERQRLIALLAAQKRASQQRARDLARQRYLEARRKALLAYYAALRANAIARAKALADQKRKKALYDKKLAAYNRLRQIKPGQECNLPDVQQAYQCRTGMLPIPHRQSGKHG
jgi:hypothetical protein